MFARKRFDIGWLDMIGGLASCVTARDEARAARAVESWFDDADAFACLSVRSGLDLYLEMLALPAGSEVLMSALTIPDMKKVVERHGLVVVPVDVETASLAPRPGAWRAACTARTRLAIVAHLFGTRVPLEPLLALRAERGVIVLEDCAQAFTGADYKGHPQSDVAMFSFGPIKTATALAGGVLRVRDPQILARMRATHATWPVQSRGSYAKRILKYAWLKALSTRFLYEGFVGACALFGTSPDKVIQGTVRGFKGGEFFQKIRHRPSAPLLEVLARRLRHGSERRVAARTSRSQRLIERSGAALEYPGSTAPFKSFWVFAVLSNRPEELVARLWERGFDATQAATLSALPAPASHPQAEPREARAMLARLVYVPVYPEIPESKIDEIASIVRSMPRLSTEVEEEEISRTQLA
jgi:dTDP-4-amino-4,6-dideoxygalactose transaminase